MIYRSAMIWKSRSGIRMSFDVKGHALTLSVRLLKTEFPAIRMLYGQCSPSSRSPSYRHHTTYIIHLYQCCLYILISKEGFYEDSFCMVNLLKIECLPSVLYFFIKHRFPSCPAIWHLQWHTLRTATKRLALILTHSVLCAPPFFCLDILTS